MSALPDAATPLSADEAAHAFGLILDGKVAPEDIQHFLTIMSERDETSVEIAAAVRAMRKRMIPINAPEGAIDVCGTGGDGSHSLNISTAVAIVVAACEVPVAKHGNRAASSKAGAADTLEALGLDLDRASEHAEATLADLGICFLFAQKHHPALAPLAPIRKAIGRRTIFNLTGPLCNPAGVQRQLVGVPRIAVLPVYADALHALGSERFMIVCGDLKKMSKSKMVYDPTEPGLDEISVSGATAVIQFPAQYSQAHGPLGSDRGIEYTTTNPEYAGLPYHRFSALKGGDPQYNAAALLRLLDGEHGAYRDAVLINAAGALMVAGHADSWENGVEEAAEAIDKGLAKALLNCWIAYK